MNVMMNLETFIHQARWSYDALECGESIANDTPWKYSILQALHCLKFGNTAQQMVAKYNFHPAQLISVCGNTKFLVGISHKRQR